MNNCCCCCFCRCCWKLYSLLPSEMQLSSLYNNLISWLFKSMQFISIRRLVIADPSSCLCWEFFRLTYTFHLSTYDISSRILFERLNSTLLLFRSPEIIYYLQQKTI